MSRAAAVTPSSPLARWWQRWRFHLNVLLVLIPLGFMPRYFQDVALFRGDSGLGQGTERQLQVGPYAVRIAETRLFPPLREGEAGYRKLVSAALCDGCGEQVRATYVRVGKPRNLRTAGSIFFGSPYRMVASLAVPEHPRGASDLWVTIETWDGSLHQASLPLATLSPVTADWLEQRK